MKRLKHIMWPAMILFLWITIMAGPVHADNVKLTIMIVKNLYCGSCLIKIDTTLKKNDAMLGMRASIKRGLIAVYHQPSITSQKIADYISEIGFPARIMVTRIVEMDPENVTPPTGQGCCSTSLNKNQTNRQPNSPAGCCGTAATTKTPSQEQLLPATRSGCCEITQTPNNEPEDTTDIPD